MSEATGSSSDRRDFLRRSAVLGASTAWAVPLVQALGRGRAAAASTGIYRVQFTVEGEGAGATLTRVAATDGAGGCLPAGWTTANPDPGGAELPITTTGFHAAAGGTLTLTDTDGCAFVAGAGNTKKHNTADQCEPGTVNAKSITFGGASGNRFYRTLRLIVNWP